MKIGINALFLIPKEVGGTEYHLRTYIDILEKKDKENDYVLFCNRENYETFTIKSKHWKKILCPINASNRIIRILYEQIFLPFLVKQQGCDILHSPGYFGPIFTQAKRVVTIHDANWKDHPEDFSSFERLILDFLIRANLKTADKIITDSPFSKSRLLYYYPSLEKKLEVVEGRIGEKFLKFAKRKLKPPLKEKDYILCVSAMYPHKRVPYLLEIWEEIIQHNQKLNLVLIGRHGLDEGKVLSSIKELDRVVHFKKISLEKLVAFYKYAKVFISPSIYEGFGLPVYEAVALKVPSFVGNKKLYSNTIKPFLRQLNGKADKDAQLIISMLTKNKKKYV